MSNSEFSFDHISRRQAIKLLGGGAGLALLAGCGPFDKKSVSTTSIPAYGGGAFVSPTEIVSTNGVMSVDLTAAETMLPWEGGQRFALTYNGGVHGPTLRARPGDTIAVSFTNNLSEPTNIHTHGLHVSPNGASDNAFRTIDPGDTQNYLFEIPATHPSGTFWYHPHLHGLSAPQLAGGLAGVLIIEDAIDDTADFKAMNERVIVLSDPPIGTNSSILNVSEAVKQEGREGGATLVNGVSQPKLTGKVGVTERWRIVNASTSRYHVLSITGADMHHIANGQERFSSPVQRTDILLTPGQRAEVLIPTGSAGTITLNSTTHNRGMMMGDMGGDMDHGDGGDMMGGSSDYIEKTTTLLSLEVQGSNSNVRALPLVINPSPTSVPNTIDKTRQISFGAMSMGNGEFVIDGKFFKHDRVDATAQLGTTEDWVIKNNSMMPHPFHIHVWPFAVISRSDGSAPDEGWRDTVNIPTGQSVTIRIPVENYGGKTVYHCHILDHEDLGMMGIIDVKSA